MTYGSRHVLPVKSVKVNPLPSHGPFKVGDPAHVGINKTFGGGKKSSEYRYAEEREED
jgi:hypothetical protein